ncbi:hypothetical protein A4S06_04830 [Erysipelotrichaceae bacterium MTC7]|nr:hypothetical protein A4S06_04830 [Erysipelotrichaceae bacterium MTC7]
MKLRLYVETTFREIKQSFGRFIAIVLIIFMGVLLFVGIKSVGPDLETSLNQVIDAQSMSDIVVQSTLGFSADDKKEVEAALSTANVELAYSFPVVEQQEQNNLQLYNLSNKISQNEVSLVSGVLPQHADEIVLDNQLKEEYPLGSIVVFHDDSLQQSDYRVVGYVESVLYVANAERGVTNIGDGQLHGFAYVNDEAIASDVPSIMYIQFKDLVDVDMFSSTYENKIESYSQILDNVLIKRKEARKEELQEQALDTIEKHELEVKDNQQKLDDAKKQIDDGLLTITNQKTSLETQRVALQDQLVTLQNQQTNILQQKAQVTAQYGEDVAQAQFASALAQVEAGIDQVQTGIDQVDAGMNQLVVEEQKIKENHTTLQSNQANLDQAKAEIETSKQEVMDMDSATYITNQRKDLPGFSEYTSLSDRIDAIANAFPIFFFAIAILITFTTVTRMIEENRKEIGTLKALGYRNGEIAIKYVLYALLASSLGIIVGVYSGSKLLPPVVFSMLQSQYIIGDYVALYWASPIVIATLLSLASTLCSTAYVLLRDLREKPTVLLLPKAPKSGKRVLLERITFFWSRLSFQMKVTLRNIFRYKGRSILTIAGIAGCCGLMLTGFGLQDSVGEPAVLQFGKLNKMDAIVTMESSVNKNELDEVKTFLAKDTKVEENLSVYSEQVTFRAKDVSKQNASLYVLSSTSNDKDFFALHDASNKHRLPLSKQGAIISDRLAKIFKVSQGDTLDMVDAGGTTYTIKIAGISENYLGHNVYMSQTYYEKVCSKTYQENTFLLKTKDINHRSEQELRESLMQHDGVQNVTYMSTQLEKQELLVENLSVVVIIIIFLSGTLAFVVLYNLTNINISERERELATLKVLGFQSGEVTMHIVRENIFFTIIGILLGFGVGYVLTWFILEMASSDLAVFPVIIKPYAYGIAAGLTIVFTCIVTCITHVKLKHIHMIEALKSVD